MKTRLAALLLCALPHLASAQMVYGPATITSGSISSTVRVTPNGQAETSLGAALAAVGGCPLSGCTFSGAVNTNSSLGFQIGGVTVVGPVPGGSGVVTSATTDYATSGGNTRYNMHQAILSPSVDTNNIWENDNSFLTLNGPGQALHEINIKHAYFQNNLGATAVQVEDFEASMQNFGSIGTFDNYLGIMNNTTTGVVTGNLNQITLGLQNDNVTVGAIASYTAINCQPWTGAGSAPTLNFCLTNRDATAQILSLGQLGLGSLTPLGANVLFQIQGPDALSTTFPISVKNNAAKTPFSVNDAGTVTVLSNIIIGLSGSSPAGTISLLNATSGSVKLAPPAGALGTPILTMPALTDTVAVLGSNQTHTAVQTFSGTLNASGVLQGNGVAGVTCATGAPTASFSSSNGIVTHC